MEGKRFKDESPSKHLLIKHNIGERKMQTDKEILSVPEAAKYLGISKNGAYELCRSKNFPVLRIGKKTLKISRKELEKWVIDNSYKNGGQ